MMRTNAVPIKMSEDSKQKTDEREIFGIKQVRECGSSLRHRIKTNGISQSALDGGCPCSRACQPKFKVARSLRKCVFCDKFEIVGLMVFPSELR